VTGFIESSKTTLREPDARLRCIEPNCLAEFPITSKLYTCSQCGGLLDVSYAISSTRSAEEQKREFRARKASQDPLERSGVWRFRELLPFVADLTKVVTLFEGNTPIYNAPRSAGYAGLDALRFKHQGLNPTGSFKDNGMTTGVTQAVALGAPAVACASTGNT
jgi:threonine synthase